MKNKDMLLILFIILNIILLYELYTYDCKCINYNDKVLVNCFDSCETFFSEDNYGNKVNVNYVKYHFVKYNNSNHNYYCKCYSKKKYLGHIIIYHKNE